MNRAAGNVLGVSDCVDDRLRGLEEGRTVLKYFNLANLRKEMRVLAFRRM